MEWLSLSLSNSSDLEVLCCVALQKSVNIDYMNVDPILYAIRRYTIVAMAI